MSANPGLGAAQPVLSLTLCPGINITAEQIPELLKSYIASLPSPPESWSSLGPLLGGIRNSISDLKWVTKWISSPSIHFPPQSHDVLL